MSVYVEHMIYLGLSLFATICYAYVFKCTVLV